MHDVRDVEKPNPTTSVFWENLLQTLTVYGRATLSVQPFLLKDILPQCAMTCFGGVLHSLLYAHVWKKKRSQLTSVRINLCFGGVSRSLLHAHHGFATDDTRTYYVSAGLHHAVSQHLPTHGLPCS